MDDKREFAEHCAVCHPNGGNTINKMKPLKSIFLKTSKIKSSKNIIAKMRNLGSGMTRFDEKTISNEEANAIAEYILRTFK